MSRRRLEHALQAGKDIGRGKNWPTKFTKVEIFKDIKLEPHLEGIFSLQYSYDGETLAVGHGNGAITLYNTQTGELKEEIRKSRYGGLAVMCMRFNPKDPNILLAGTSEGLVFACNISTGDVKEVITEKHNEINCLDFSADGFNFATGGKDLSIRIYDTKTLKIVNTYEGYSEKKAPTELESSGCAMRVFALKYHPDIDHIFITGGWENHLKVWDCRSNDGVKRTIWGPHICGDSLDIKAEEGGGSHILTGSWQANNALQIFNYSNEKEVKNVPFPAENGAFLYCAQFCDNDVVVAGGSGTNSAKAINTETKECLGEVPFTKPVQALDSVHGGRMFAVGSGDNSLKLARLT